MIAEKGPQWGSDLLGWTKALFLEASGDTPKALASLASGWGASESVRYLFGRPAFPDIVRLAMAAGDHEYAARVTEQAEEGRRRAPDVRSASAVALRCRGLLEDDTDDLLGAVEAYRSTPRVVERAAACEDAARCFARRGKTSEARSLFVEAVLTFEELGAVHDSSRVSAAMRSAGIRRGAHGPRRRPATGWEALTPTEIEIARLTVEGLTNPRIAERLFISKRTVQAHLSHIFGKLGVSSRVALARIAADRLRDVGS
jgi:DNA-binding CsgD family transcriptional regulator